MAASERHCWVSRHQRSAASISSKFEGSETVIILGILSETMENVKKWCVTYTNHIKQKRKLYLDGFLHFHSSNRKAKLFDECEKLLEIKILKNNEAVKSGETLTFNTYFVDVGDPSGDHKPVPDWNSQDNDKKNTQNSGFMRRQRFMMTNPVLADNTYGRLEKNEARKSNLSPSLNIIREFKKSKMIKYGAMQSSTDPTQSSTPEWQVMYTSQKTQKAKKYHDGILQLKFCGTLGRQAKLFDDCEQLLEVKILKKDEAVRSNETMIFHAYLVDIGEPKGDHKPNPDLNYQGNDKKITQNSGFLHHQRFTIEPVVSDYVKASSEKNKIHKSNSSPSEKIIEEFKKNELKKYGAMQSSPDSTKSGVTGWQVLYTTQLTQKSKKYHDGILRLKFCGSQGRQARLYDANKTLLDSRFLKKYEVIRSDETIRLDGHLVDIGEPEKNNMPATDLNDRNYNEARQTGTQYEQQCGHQANKNAVSLLSEDGNTQSSKLKFSKESKSESISEAPTYMVDVVDMGIIHEGASQGNACVGEDLNLSFGRSRAGGIQANTDVLTNKPLRSASAILSILKSSMPRQSATPISKAPAEQFHSSKPSNLVDSDLQDQVQGQPVQDCNTSRSLLEDYEVDFKVFDEETRTEHTSKSEIGNSNAIRGGSANVFIKLENASGKGELELSKCSDDEKKTAERLETREDLFECPSFDLGF